MRSLRFSTIGGAFLLLLLWACSGGPSADSLKHHSGYWEISGVEFPDGSRKSYPVNSTVEYFQWDGGVGYRKKVQPTLGGTFLTSDDALALEVAWRDSRLFLSFPRAADPWEEEVLELNENQLITRHSNGLQYEYTRYQPLTNPE